MKVKLLEPIDGYEDTATLKVPENGEVFLFQGGDIVTSEGRYIGEHLVLSPVKKKYDHSKSADYVLYRCDNVLVRRRELPAPANWGSIDTGWIAHFGGPCPFDERASVVEVRLRDGMSGTDTAHSLRWPWEDYPSDIIAVRFVKLAEGYTYD